jgi:hypothetical protein
LPVRAGAAGGDVTGPALLVGDVTQAEGDPVDQLREPVDSFRGGVGDPQEYGARDLVAPVVDRLGEGDELGDVVAEGRAVVEEPVQGPVDVGAGGGAPGAGRASASASSSRFFAVQATRIS